MHSISVLPGAPASPLRSAKAIAKDEGVCDVTIWRRVKAGLLTQVNINGRAYITLDSLNDFYRRAAAGEFAKPFHGVAAPSGKKFQSTRRKN